MKISKKQAISENLLYLMVWLAIILVPVLNSRMMSEMNISIEKILIAWRQIAPYLLIFLIHNSIIAPRFMLTHRYWWYVTIDLVLIIATFCGLELYETITVVNSADASTLASMSDRVSFTNLSIYWNIVLGFFMTGANAGIKLMYQSIRDEQKMESLLRQNLEVEMDYLKYQINPHFFMNTLNNIHALIDIDTESAKSAIIELSKMMRYVLYDSGHEQIPLEKDLLFMHNYVELMRIRYTKDIDIQFDFPSPLPQNIKIPPLLLIVFVENAFKHGVSYNHPSFIRMKVEYADHTLTANISNSRHTHKEKESHGIGLDNVRKRLSLIYGERSYTLQIDDKEPKIYTVKLVIPTLNA